MKKYLVVFISLLLITACSGYDFQRHVIQQGNLLPKSKIKRLKIGMSKHDVAILMGTSLLSPVFNNNRWDYAFTWRRGNGPNQIRHVILYFKNGRLARIAHKP